MCTSISASRMFSSTSCICQRALHPSRTCSRELGLGTTCRGRKVLSVWATTQRENTWHEHLAASCTFLVSDLVTFCPTLLCRWESMLWDMWSSCLWSLPSISLMNSYSWLNPSLWQSLPPQEKNLWPSPFACVPLTESQAERQMTAGLSSWILWPSMPQQSRTCKLIHGLSSRASIPFLSSWTCSIWLVGQC